MCRRKPCAEIWVNSGCWPGLQVFVWLSTFMHLFSINFTWSAAASDFSRRPLHYIFLSWHSTDTKNTIKALHWISMSPILCQGMFVSELPISIVIPYIRALTGLSIFSVSETSVRQGWLGPRCLYRSVVGLFCVQAQIANSNISWHSQWSLLE